MARVGWRHHVSLEAAVFACQIVCVCLSVRPGRYHNVFTPIKNVCTELIMGEYIISKP